MKQYQRYIKNVQTGKRIAGKLEKLAVARFEKMRKMSEKTMQKFIKTFFFLS